MTQINAASSIVHYICQTYVETKVGRGGQVGLKVGKQFKYSTAQEAQSRAEREYRSEDCTGADAYMVTEDPDSGEVGEPRFIERFGAVPDVDE